MSQGAEALPHRPAWRPSPGTRQVRQINVCSRGSVHLKKPTIDGTQCALLIHVEFTQLCLVYWEMYATCCGHCTLHYVANKMYAAKISDFIDGENPNL